MLNLDGLDEEKINKLQVKKENHRFKRDSYSLYNSIPIQRVTFGKIM